MAIRRAVRSELYARMQSGREKTARSRPDPPTPAGRRTTTNPILGSSFSSFRLSRPRSTSTTCASPGRVRTVGGGGGGYRDSGGFCAGTSRGGRRLWRNTRLPAQKLTGSTKATCFLHLLVQFVGGAPASHRSASRSLAAFLRPRGLRVWGRCSRVRRQGSLRCRRTRRLRLDHRAVAGRIMSSRS